MDALPNQSNAAEKLAEFRREILDELPNLAREMIDVARAEATPQAYEKVLNIALKTVEGMQVQEKKDPYANLPVIHMTINGGSVTTQVSAPEPIAAIDVQATVLPDAPTSPFGASASKTWAMPADPTELLDSTPMDADQQAVLDALTAAGSAMVMD